MRSSLVPGMLNMLAYNLNRGADHVRLFEAGGVFEATGAATAEPKRMSMGATSSPLQKAQGWGAHDGGFFELKGDVESLLHPFDHKALTFDAQTADYYHRGRSARVLMDGAVVAQLGQIHSDIAATRKLRQATIWPKRKPKPKMSVMPSQGRESAGWGASPRMPRNGASSARSRNRRRAISNVPLLRSNSNVLSKSICGKNTCIQLSLMSPLMLSE